MSDISEDEVGSKEPKASKDADDSGNTQICGSKICISTTVSRLILILCMAVCKLCLSFMCPSPGRVHDVETFCDLYLSLSTRELLVDYIRIAKKLIN